MQAGKRISGAVSVTTSTTRCVCRLPCGADKLLSWTLFIFFAHKLQLLAAAPLPFTKTGRSESSPLLLYTPQFMDLGQKLGSVSHDPGHIFTEIFFRGLLCASALVKLLEVGRKWGKNGGTEA